MPASQPYIDRLTTFGIDAALFGMGIAGATQSIPALVDGGFPDGLTNVYGYIFAGLAVLSSIYTVTLKLLWLAFASIVVSLASLVVLDITVWALVAEQGGGGRAYFFYVLWVPMIIQARRLIGLGYERGRLRVDRKGSAE